MGTVAADPLFEEVSIVPRNAPSQYVRVLFCVTSAKCELLLLYKEFKLPPVNASQPLSEVVELPLLLNPNVTVSCTYILLPMKTCMYPLKTARPVAFVIAVPVGVTELGKNHVVPVPLINKELANTRVSYTHTYPVLSRT